MSQVLAIVHTALEQLRRDAALTTRQRLHLNVHRSYESNPQILYNCLTRESYMRPHRHTQDGREEFFVCLAGETLLVTFSDLGEVNGVFDMAASGPSKISSVVIEPSVWHTLVCKSEEAMLLEVKPGPFQPHLAKEFAPWSPEEGDSLGLIFLKQTIAQFIDANSNGHLNT